MQVERGVRQNRDVGKRYGNATHRCGRYCLWDIVTVGHRVRLTYRIVIAVRGG